ncbi:MAG TPA: response regulator transcription factor [Chloroflexia bacterium]|nr:response regulator transcription factor [Chloroflexia bacterium]
MAQQILVVDDDHHITRLVQAYLEQEGYQVRTAATGTDGLHLLRHTRPDLLLLDLMLPDRSGWDLTRLIRQDPALSTLPIILLTARVEDTDKILGLELGADDYITKPFNPREVVARVRALLRRVGGGPPPVPAVLQVGALRLDVAGHQVTLAQQSIEVTPTEFALLQVLVTHPGQVFTRLQLIEQALGSSYAGLERTVDSHIRNLRKKIEPDPTAPRYIQAVFGVGYRLRREEDPG